jgi:hypothetical protein
LPQILSAFQAEQSRAAQRRRCPICELFTLTLNEILITGMGYHGALWASTGTGTRTKPKPLEEAELPASRSLSSIKPNEELLRLWPFHPALAASRLAA